MIRLGIEDLAEILPSDSEDSTGREHIAAFLVAIAPSDLPPPNHI